MNGLITVSRGGRLYPNYVVGVKVIWQIYNSLWFLDHHGKLLTGARWVLKCENTLDQNINLLLNLLNGQIENHLYVFLLQDLQDDHYNYWLLSCNANSHSVALYTDRGRYQGDAARANYQKHMKPNVQFIDACVHCVVTCLQCCIWVIKDQPEENRACIFIAWEQGIYKLISCYDGWHRSDDY